MFRKSWRRAKNTLAWWIKRQRRNWPNCPRTRASTKICWRSCGFKQRSNCSRASAWSSVANVMSIWSRLSWLKWQINKYYNSVRRRQCHRRVQAGNQPGAIVRDQCQAIPRCRLGRRVEHFKQEWLDYCEFIASYYRNARLAHFRLKTRWRRDLSSSPRKTCQKSAMISLAPTRIASSPIKKGLDYLMC